MGLLTEQGWHRDSRITKKDGGSSWKLHPRNSSPIYRDPASQSCSPEHRCNVLNNLGKGPLTLAELLDPGKFSEFGEFISAVQEGMLQLRGTGHSGGAGEREQEQRTAGSN